MFQSLFRSRSAIPIPDQRNHGSHTDGKLVLVSRLSIPAGAPAGSIVVYDAATRKELKRIDAGPGVGGILMHPDGTRAYAASSRDHLVRVIDLKTLEVVGRIDAGRQPDGLAWAVRP